LILYFLRHGKAGQPRPVDDDARELTPKGEAALRAAAPLWRRLRIRPDLVVSSPLPRALRTAQLFAEGLGLDDPPTVDERLAPGASWDGMAGAMADHGGGEQVVFVGHDPDMSRAIASLTGAAAVRVRKGAIGAVAFDGAAAPGEGELLWLLDPDLYGDDAA
jgi:phosphohistidine phosphatase